MDGVAALVSAMLPSNLPVLITAVLALAAGFVLCASTHGAKVGQLFLQVTGFLFVYLAGRYLTLESGDAELAYAWALITSIGVLCAPIAIYHYVAHLVDIAPERRLFLAVNWLFAIGMVVMNLMTGFLYDGVKLYEFGYVPQYSEWGALNSAWTVLVMTVALLDFAQQYRGSAPGSLRQKRFRAFFLAQLWVFPLYLDSIASHGVAMPQLGWVAVFIYVASVMRSAERYRFVDITPEFAAQKVLDTVGEAILVLDAEGEVRVANQPAVELLRRNADVLVGMPAELLLPQLHKVEIERLLAAHEGDFVEQEFEFESHDQSRVMAMHVSRLRGSGSGSGYVCSLRDVSRQKQVERQLRYESLHDSLTGLPNRVAFQAQLEYQLRAQENGGKVSVLFIDLNDFKKINDQHGHRAGDEVLATVARRLQRACPEDSLVSRLAGDEFAVLMKEAGDAESSAKAMAKALAKPVNIEQGAIQVGVSIGISHAGGEGTGDSALALLKDADYAMYKAKSQGGGFQVFDRSMRSKTAARAILEGALREAMENDEMATWYQPVVDVSGASELNLMEALLRWEHPERGVVEAREFIEVAENSSMILELGQHALGNICQFLRRWLQASPNQPIRVSCNVSEMELAQEDLPERLAQTLKYYGVPAECIELEVTERATIGAYDKSLWRLRDLGIRLVIDDFGRGVSSLSRLANLPVDAIKIDRSFNVDINTSNTQQTVVKTIVALGQELHLDVIAQGVETPEQSQMLQDMGCNLQQGLLFGEALEPLSVVARTQRHPTSQRLAIH
jgi:diguanylate cyclase (GGDEF)-like protein/PAS domain S-box-containing protein